MTPAGMAPHDEFQKLLDAGAADKSPWDPKALTPERQAMADALLLSAARDGNAHIANVALGFGAFPAALDALGRGAVALCCRRWRGPPSLECFELLMEHCDPGILDHEGTSALDVAALHGFSPGVARLMGSIDASRANPTTGWTPLHHAAMAGHFECVDLLMRSCDPRAREKLGKNAAEMASAHGSPECAALLQARIDALDQTDAIARCSSEPQAPGGAPARL